MTLAEKIWGSSIGAFIAYGKTAAAAALKPLLVTDNGDGTGTLVVSASSSALPTGAATTSPNIDCGIGSSATTDYTNVFDDLPGETIGLYNSKIATPGAQTQPILWRSGAGNRYLNMSIKDAAATGMVATYVATVMGL